MSLPCGWGCVVVIISRLLYFCFMQGSNSKRILLLLVVFLYLIPSIGFTVSVHYCGGKLASVSFLDTNESKKCPCGSGMSKKSCCENVVLSLKLSGQQQKNTPPSWDVAVIALLPVKTTFESLISTVVERPVPAYLSESPPGRFKQPIYLQNESFLI